MKPVITLLALALLLLTACRRASETQPPAAASDPVRPATTEPPATEGARIEGRWQGAIDIANTLLDITVTFTRSGDGLAATIDIPQQGAAGLPLDGVTLDGDAVRFAIGSVGATFDGVVNGDAITGEFAQSGLTGTFSLTRIGDAPTPAPVSELPYRSEDVSWALDDTTMDATLTIPEGDGPHPAVVFIAGSGPTDRNWNSPLLPGRNGSAALLADELTRAGYATLRYDKRFTGPHAQENMPKLLGNISFQSHLDEVAAAVDYLAAQPGVDPQRIYVLANSEGTLHALNYQSSDPAIPFAGLILTGAPGRSMTSVMRQQIAENILGGAPGVEETLALWDEAVTAFVAGEEAQLDPSLPEALQQLWAGLVAPANQPFSRELLATDPAALLAGVDAPTLVLIGQKDIQIDWQADGQALEAAAGDNVTFSYPPDANHVLKHEPKPAEELTAADGATYNAADRTLDAEALQTILRWLAGQAGGSS